MGQIIGIDLGITNTAVASASRSTVYVSVVGAVLWERQRQPQLLLDRDNRAEFPSIVGLKKRKQKKDGPVDAEEILVGNPAVDNWPMAPEDTIVAIRRLMGRAVADKEVERIRKNYDYAIVAPSDGTKDSVRVVMGGKQYSPVEISAMILKKAKADAEFRLGEPVTHAVITVPAYFSQRQKKATRDAGLLAGLQVIKILDEPTAAAVAFGMDNKDNHDPRCILVYDLGGGTFDISILMWAGNVFAQLNLEGDMWLGGDNFDKVLVDHAVAHIRKEYELDPTKDKRFMVELRKAAKATKERLSSQKAVDLTVAGLLKDAEGDVIDVVIEVTQAEYNVMIQPLVERATSLVLKALKGADLTPEQVDHVLMAGNCTCVPQVQESMEKMFGRDKMLRGIHPKQCVALGAALVATSTGLKLICVGPDPSDPKKECGFVNQEDAQVCKKCGVELVLTPAAGGIQIEIGADVRSLTAHSYGVQTAGDKYTVFIAKGESYPTENPKTQTFYTRQPNQRMNSIPVYGGDHMEKASLNEKQGEALVLLPPGLPEGAAVRICFRLDSDGVFDLTASLEDGTDLAPVILQGEKDQRAIAEIEKAEAAFKEESLDPEKRARLESKRNEAFSRFRQKDFDGVEAVVKEVRDIIEESANVGDEEALRTKGDNLVSFTQFVMHEFGWALPAEKVYALNRTLEATREALHGSDLKKLEQLVKELDDATDDLPPLVRGLMGLRGAIQQRIRPLDPTAGQRLWDELEAVERAIKANEGGAVDRLNALVGKVDKAIENAPKTVVRKCPRCKSETGGSRHCPNCKEDTWQMDTKAGASSSDIRSGTSA